MNAPDFPPAEESDSQRLLDEALAYQVSASEDGRPCCLESILEEFPTLANSHEARLAIAYNEYQLADVSSKASKRSELLRSHPDLAAALQRQFDFANALAAFSGGNLASAVPEPAPITEIGRFTVRRLLGHGGMGTVFLADDQLMNRQVAIKIPKPELLWDERGKERFLHEARVAARLQHPNLLAIYEVAFWEQGCYVASHFADGGDLAQFIKDLPRPLEEEIVMPLLMKIADALAHCHREGVVHLDLKPANVLFSSASDDTDDAFPGNPLVADFGLARGIDENLQLTQTSQLLGTPLYMAPEQVVSNREQIGPQTDVFAFGIMMHELLFGKRPFNGPTVVEVLDQIRNVRRQKVSSKNVSRNVLAVIDRCLQLEPEHRYQDAGALRQDLAKVINGQPIKARRTSVIRCAVRWIRNNPLTSMMVCMTSVFLLLAARQAWLLRDASISEAALRDWGMSEKKKAGEARDKYDESARQAQRLANELAAELYLSDTTEALEAFGRGQMFSVKKYTEKYRGDDYSSLRGFEYKLLEAVSSIKPIAEFTGHPGKVLNLAAYDNGRKIASVGAGRDAFLWDVETESLEAKISDNRWTLGALQDFALGTTDSTNNEFRAVAVSPDGKYLATGNVTLGLWELSTGKKVRTLGRFATPVYGVAFSPDSRFIAAHCANFSLKIFDLSGDVVRTINTESHGRRICFSADGSRLFAPECIDGAIFVTEFDTASWKPVHQYTRGVSSHGIALSEKHGLLFITRNQDFDVIDVQTREHLIRSEEYSGVITDVAVSPDESHAAISLSSGLAAVVPLNRKYWEAAGRPVRAKERVFAAHSGATESVQFLDNGTLATGGGDGAVRIWGLSALEAPLNHRLSGRVALAKNRPGTRELIVVDLNVAGRTALKRFDLREQTITQELELFDPGDLDPADSLAVSRDGRFAAVGGSSSEVHVVDLELNKSVLDFRQDDIRPSGIRDIALSPDGKLMATASADHTIRIWDVSTGKILWLRRCAGHGINVEFSGDGKRLAFSEDQGVLGILDTSDLSVLTESNLQVPTSISTVQFTSDADICAVLTNGKVAMLDSNSLQVIRTLEGPAMRSWDLAIAPEGNLLAGADEEGVRLWHLPSGKLLGTLLSGLNIRTVSFTDSGDSLAAVDYSAGSSLVVWDVATSEPGYE